MALGVKVMAERRAVQALYSVIYAVYVVFRIFQLVVLVVNGRAVCQSLPRDLSFPVVERAEYTGGLMRLWGVERDRNKHGPLRLRNLGRGEESKGPSVSWP